MSESAVSRSQIVVFHRDIEWDKILWNRRFPCSGASLEQIGQGLLTVCMFYLGQMCYETINNCGARSPIK